MSDINMYDFLFDSKFDRMNELLSVEETTSEILEENLFKSLLAPNPMTKGNIEPQDTDIIANPTTDGSGNTIHAASPNDDHEVQLLKDLFNKSSKLAQNIFIQKIVKNYPDEVTEFLNEINSNKFV